MLYCPPVNRGRKDWRGSWTPTSWEREEEEEEEAER